ncbi:hypothetical protein AOLI_G00136340 [Acnodon oligacanthus]
MTEIVANFQKIKSLPALVTIQGENTEVVNIYKNLNVHMCGKLGWEVNIDKLYKKSYLFNLRTTLEIVGLQIMVTYQNQEVLALIPLPTKCLEIRS